MIRSGGLSVGSHNYHTLHTHITFSSVNIGRPSHRRGPATIEARVFAVSHHHRRITPINMDDLSVSPACLTAPPRPVPAHIHTSHHPNQDVILSDLDSSTAQITGAASEP